MAVAPQLPEATRLSIADQIGQLLPASDLASQRLVKEGFPLELAESLPVVALPLSAVQRDDMALGEAVRFTGRWHHQVAAGENFVAARSVDHGEEHEVVEVSSSTIPIELARTIRWVDENLPGDQLAAMMLVPDYYLTAIMLRSDAGDQVIVSQRPDRLVEIRTDRVYEGREFIALLRQYPPSTGIPNGGPARG